MAQSWPWDSQIAVKKKKFNCLSTVSRHKFNSRYNKQKQPQASDTINTINDILHEMRDVVKSSRQWRKDIMDKMQEVVSYVRRGFRKL